MIQSRKYAPAFSLVMALSALCSAGPMPQLPLVFESNQGQHDASILFSSRVADGRVTLAKSDVSFWDAEGLALRMHLDGASAGVRIEPQNTLASRVNYFSGSDSSRWRAEIPTHAGIRYQGVYPGIDLVFYSSPSGRLEYDFIVAPGADPSQIRLRLEGRGQFHLTKEGRLAARTSAGEVVHQAPVIYQEQDGKRSSRAGGYRLDGAVLRFATGAYDAKRPLVIDPVVEFSSFLGGAGGEEGRGIALDAAGNIYLTGFTTSLNFPTQNPFQPNRTNTLSEVYVTKLNPTGSAMIFSTYIGGTSGDEGRSIAVGADGAVYVGGTTSGLGFPTTPGAFRTTPLQQGDAFLLKLNPAGSQLVYSTLLAGARSDVVTAIAADDAGNLFATGHTASDDFPVTAGSAQAARPFLGNSNDAFVVKLNPTGSGLVYSTLFGGTGDDEAFAIALHGGSALITGGGESTNLPVTAGAVQSTRKGTIDAFVAKVNPAGSAFTFATYLGGTNVDRGYGITTDVFGDVYVSGTTLATDFPATTGAFQSQRRFGEDGFVVKLAANGSALIYSTYLGSDISDHLNSIAVDRHGAAYVVGNSAGTYPVTAQGLQPQSAGEQDLVITKLGFDGRRLLYSSFFGGAGAERAPGTGSDGGGNTLTLRDCKAYITGRSNSNNFPLAAAMQTIRAGLDDSIFAKVDPSADLGEPQIDCAAGFLAPLQPLVDTWSPRSIGTLFGKNFSSATGLNPQVGPNGLITTNLANTCLEIDGRRAPMYFVNATQINFQVPVETALGWVRVFAIRNCDQGNAVRSEPLFIEIKPRLPQFFVFSLSPLAVAAVNDTATAATGAVVIVGPASAGAPYTPVNPGDIVSAYFTGGGTTTPGLGTGQIPGAAFALNNSSTVRLGSVTLSTAEVFYVGASPCCAGLDQLTFRVPSNMPPGNHQLILTTGGIASPNGPTISVR